MHIIIRILVGGLTGWLTGKALEIEGRQNVVKEGHVLDVIYGVVGAMVGEYLFFWIVIGQGDALSSYGTTVLGSITLVGTFRFLVARFRPGGSPKRDIPPGASKLDG
jgi:uncharacterized membrane protein YeaQ/YmgE (transglycosylase-associated protein family)